MNVVLYLYTDKVRDWESTRLRRYAAERVRGWEGTRLRGYAADPAPLLATPLSDPLPSQSKIGLVTLHK
jgi:hypothetical protein